MQLKQLASSTILIVLLACGVTPSQGQVPKPDPDTGDPPPPPGRNLDSDVAAWKSNMLISSKEKREPDKKDPDPGDPPGPKA